MDIEKEKCQVCGGQANAVRFRRLRLQQRGVRGEGQAGAGRPRRTHEEQTFSPDHQDRGREKIVTVLRSSLMILEAARTCRSMSGIFSLPLCVP